MYEDESLMKLLAVDDDRGTLAIFKNALAGLGLRIFTATSSESALDVVKSEHPQIVLLDLVLPEVTGFELLDRILPIDPFVSIDQQGVGELIHIANERGRKTRKNLKLGIRIHLIR